MRLYGAFTKVEPQSDGTIRVEGIASSEGIDDQGEIILAAAMRQAIPDYMVFPALREMHQLSAAGTTLEAEVGDDGMTRIVGHVVDPVAISKIKNQVYRGFSIGGRVTKRDMANNKIITGIQLNEISLVDRPANPQAVMECWKSSNIERTDDMKSGLATLAETPAGEVLAAAAASTDPGADAAKTAAAALMVPVQIWHCGDGSHSHVAKGEAIKCIEKRAAAGENGGTQWEPKPASEAAVDEPVENSASVDKPSAQPEVVASEEAEKADAHAEKADTHAEEAAEAAPEAAGEAEADAGTEAAAEADAHADDAEKAAQEPSEAEQALAKAAELAERARTALNLPAPADAAAEATETDKTDKTDKSAKADGGKDKPKGDYGDVEYADEGMQADGKPRYPLDSEKHIRAAWSYIDEEKNQKPYTAAQVAKIKAKIVAAWKSKIDKDGPPSAEKAANPFDLVKSLADVGDVAQVILFLDNLADRLEYEAAIECDDSKASDRMDANVGPVCAFLRNLVTKETSEIMSGTEMDEDMAQMAASVGDIRKAGLGDLADMIEKAAGKHTAKNQELLDMAYECASRAANLDGCSKAATDHFDSASKCMMAAGAKGWDDAKKATSEGMMVDALAKGAQHKVLADAAHDCIGKVMSGACCGTEKASKEDKDNLSMAHDHLCAAGATCPGESQKTAAVEAPEGGEQLAKVQSENAQLLKAVQDFAPLFENLLETHTSLSAELAKIHEKVDRIDQQEVPPRGLARSAGLFALSKTQDNGAAITGSGIPAAPIAPEEILKSINALPESKDKAFLLMRIAHLSPRPVQMGPQAETNLPAAQ